MVTFQLFQIEPSYHRIRSTLSDVFSTLLTYASIDKNLVTQKVLNAFTPVTSSNEIKQRSDVLRIECST
jgi:hypothetical protein